MTTLSDHVDPGVEKLEDPVVLLGSGDQFTDRDRTRMAFVEKELDRVVGRGPGPYYDSVVIAGAGFTASVMAARLARSEHFHGKVVLAGPRTTESRRVKDGLTLRGRGVDYICHALGVPQNAYVAALYGDIIDGRGVGTGNVAAMGTRNPDGSYRLSRVAPWQGGARGYSRPLFFGARNSRMQGALYELMERSGVIEVPEPITCLEEGYALAPGRRPLLVNAGHNQRLFNPSVPRVDWATVAVQAPLRPTASGLQNCPSNSALLAPVRRGNRIDVGLFNPYGDPLSPRSTYYGIIVSDVHPDRAGFDKQRELAEISEELIGIAGAMGLEVDDHDETWFQGLVPGSPWTPVVSRPGTLELQMLAHPGKSATFSDGMTSGATTAVAAAEAILRGADPDAAARRITRVIARDRSIWHFLRTRVAVPADALIRVLPEAALGYPHTLHAKSQWATRA